MLEENLCRECSQEAFVSWVPNKWSFCEWCYIEVYNDLIKLVEINKSVDKYFANLEEEMKLNTCYDCGESPTGHNMLTGRFYCHRCFWKNVDLE